MSGTPLHRASVTASLLVPDLRHDSRGTPDVGQHPTPAPEAPGRGHLRLRSYLLVSATCAILIPIAVAVIAQFTEDGPARVLLTWLIALLMGVAMYASTASQGRRRRRTS